MAYIKLLTVQLQVYVAHDNKFYYVALTPISQTGVWTKHAYSRTCLTACRLMSLCQSWSSF